jgi:hypothetical protein
MFTAPAASSNAWTVEAHIELGGPRLGREKQRGRDQNKDAVGGDQRHTLELGSDQSAPPSLCQRKARTARCHERRNQEQEAPRYGHLDYKVEVMRERHAEEEQREEVGIVQENDLSRRQP